ncbi:MAG TPA: hypothetical protein VFD88_12950 [Clostridia bacterium]|nr:hypothetical protein [Clostridia bacterium]
MRRGFSFVWVVLTLVIAAIVGGVSYQAGVSTHLPAGAALPPYYNEPHFYGFGLFGILFLVFIFFLLIRLLSFGRRGWGGGHGGGWKHGGYGGGMPPAIDERMQEWHKRAHGEAPATPPPPDQRQA